MHVYISKRAPEFLSWFVMFVFAVAVLKWEALLAACVQAASVLGSPVQACHCGSACPPPA